MAYWSVPLTYLHRPAVHGLRPGFSPVHSLGIPSARGINVGQQILRTQLCEPGQGIPLTQSFLLGGGQPEGCSLPSSKVQGLGFAEVFPYDVSSGATAYGELFYWPSTSKGGLQPYPSPPGSIS